MCPHGQQCASMGSDVPAAPRVLISWQGLLSPSPGSSQMRRMCILHKPFSDLQISVSQCQVISSSHVILPFSSPPFSFSSTSLSPYSCSLQLGQHFQFWPHQTPLLRLLPYSVTSTSTAFLVSNLFLIGSDADRSHLISQCVLQSHFLCGCFTLHSFLGEEGWRRTLKSVSDCLERSTPV